MVTPPLILASTSTFRKLSLQKLQLAFDSVNPKVLEKARDHELPRDLACRLAMAKASAVATKHPNAVVIGADQVLNVNGKSFGKPQNREVAICQLKELAGKSGIFHSAVSVLMSEQQWSFCVDTEVAWLDLSTKQIMAYVDKEPSFASAGSAQLENYGICLVSKLQSDDPSAVIGLPLIRLCSVLREIGYELPG